MSKSTTNASGISISELEARLDSANKELHLLKTRGPNPDYVHLSKIYVDETIQLAHQSPGAFTVLMVLVRQMDVVNSVMISNEFLGKITKLSASTVKRSIKLLREMEWIDVVKVGTSNLYRVNSNLWWQEGEHGKWAAVQTKVVLSFDEQDVITKNRSPDQWTREVSLAYPNLIDAPIEQRQGHLPL